jgi:hypothetical protein
MGSNSGYITNKLSARSTVLLDNLTAKNSLLLYNPNAHYSTHNSLSLVPIISEIHHTCPDVIVMKSRAIR